MLIQSSRLTAADLAAWERYAAVDRANSRTLPEKIQRAVGEIDRFLAAGEAYVSVSWGKDSVATADLVLLRCPYVPLVWVRARGIENPECFPVRDRFLRRYPNTDYREIEVTPHREGDVILDNGWFERAFEQAPCRRHIYGLRRDESSGRGRRFARYGHSSTHTCAPLSLWTGDDVFAYLSLMDLPVSAVYAMSLGGSLRRDELRTDFLGMDQGIGRGRREWEESYFGDLEESPCVGDVVGP